MFTKTLHRFRALPDVTRSMVGLFWVYEFSQIIVYVFLNIFVFSVTKSLESLIIYSSVYFTACALGFVGWGYIMAHFQISMRLNYLRSFILSMTSFLFLALFPSDLPYLLLFALLNGVGFGMFWLGVHSYEMIYTEESNRDFYSSMTSLGAQTFQIISPLIATGTFFLSEKIFHIATFSVLLWILPFSYLFAFPFIFKLPDFIPEKIKSSEWKRLFTSKKLFWVRMYFLSDWKFPGSMTLYPLFALTALGSVVYVGVLETIVAIISIFTSMFLAHIRHKENRVQILLYASFGVALAMIILLFSPKLWWLYVIYSLVAIFFRPIYRISEHVIDLHSIEKLREVDAHFYPGLLFRDFILWIQRLLTLAVFFVVLQFSPNDIIAAQVSLLFVIVSLFVKWGFAKKVVNQV